MLFQELGSFLEKYRTLLQTHSVDKKVISDLLFDVCCVRIPEDAIEYKDHKIITRSSSLVRNKIFQYKGELIKRIKERYPGVSDIV